MGIPLPTQDASVYQQRRARLAQSLGERTALIVAGGERPRNYEANVYPFRADSHFLYLVGAGFPDATLMVGPAGAELFMHTPADDDALWHGESASWETLTAATGVDRIRPLEELDAALTAAGGPTRVGTLPSAEPRTRADQAELLGRTWGRAAGCPTLADADAAVADAMIALRLRHDEAALEMLRGAAAGTTAAHLAGMAATRPGLKEHAIRSAMEAALVARGQSPAYGSIVTVHGEVLHNTTHEHTLEDGDLLLADVGGEHHGWAGDVTRTWPVSGTFSPTQRTLYDIVLASQEKAIEMVRPGVRYRDVHLEASRVLARGLVDEGILKGEPDGLVERGAHALLFPHGVGHLIGLDVHDMEDLGDRAGYAPGRDRSPQFGLGYLRLDRDLEPGMMVTIEPGLYLVPAILDDPKLGGRFVADGTLDRDALARFSDVRGIRIEDDVLVTQGAPEVFTAAIPKEAAEVEAAVGAQTA